MAMNRSLSKFQEMVKDREAWLGSSPCYHKESDYDQAAEQRQM